MIGLLQCVTTPRMLTDFLYCVCKTTWGNYPQLS